MIRSDIIKINFSGGIISPAILSRITNILSRAGVREVRFGLRQQMLAEVNELMLNSIRKGFEKENIDYQTDADHKPNIISSYPAQDIFMTNGWLSEGVYKDILDALDYTPRLKINISGSGQSLTPFFTGNLNWLASEHPHYWCLFIRLPGSNMVYEWDQLVYTNDIARITKQLEDFIIMGNERSYGGSESNMESLFNILKTGRFILKPATEKAKLPVFNLPYYEGLNRYNDKSWLGIYQRDEKFPLELIRDICRLCQETRLSELCITPWKSLIIKGIEENDRLRWSALLDLHSVNIRHAANELNFQVEDHCTDGLKLKNELVQYLNKYDIRTFGICFGIKTRKKTEIYCNILIRKRYVLDWGVIRLGARYDILCAKDFNPNERTGFIFSAGNPRFLLPEQLRRAILSFYKMKPGAVREIPETKEENMKMQPLPVKVYQCAHCQTVYDETRGEPEQQVSPGTLFENLPDHYCCPLCESPRTAFILTEWTTSASQAV